MLYNWKPNRGGILNFTDSLANIQKKQNKVFIMYFHSEEVLEEDIYEQEDITYIHPFQVLDPMRKNAPVTHYSDRQVQQQILTYVVKVNPDVVHVQTCYGISSSIIPLLEKQGYKTIVHMHDYLCVCPKQNLYLFDKENCYHPGRMCKECLTSTASSQDFERRYKHNIENYNKASKIIMNSTFIEKKFIKWGIIKDKSTVILNGLDTRLCDPSTVKNRFTKDYLNKKLVFVHFSSCAPMKGVIQLVKVFNIIANEIDKEKLANLELRIYGAKSRIYKTLNSLATHKMSVKIYPPYKSEEISKIIEDADVTVLPHLWWDPLPFTVIESLFYGVPVIGSKDSGMNELIQDGINGYLIDPHNIDEFKNKIINIIHNPKIIDSMKKNVKELYLRTMNETAAEINNVYKELNV
ncbi:MAG: glycosyltransferase [Sporolactobacillus sp.]